LLTFCTIREVFCTIPSLFARNSAISLTISCSGSIYLSIVILESFFFARHNAYIVGGVAQW